MGWLSALALGPDPDKIGRKVSDKFLKEMDSKAAKKATKALKDSGKKGRW